jgi:hypothetical protein
VRFLFRDAEFRQEIDQHFRFDLEFPSQLINSNLIGICHQPLLSPLIRTCRLSRAVFFRFCFCVFAGDRFRLASFRILIR